MHSSSQRPANNQPDSERSQPKGQDVQRPRARERQARVVLHLAPGRDCRRAGGRLRGGSGIGGWSLRGGGLGSGLGGRSSRAASAGRRSTRVVGGAGSGHTPPDCTAGGSRPPGGGAGARGGRGALRRSRPSVSRIRAVRCRDSPLERIDLVPGSPEHVRNGGGALQRIRPRNLAVSRHRQGGEGRHCPCEHDDAAPRAKPIPHPRPLPCGGCHVPISPRLPITAPTDLSARCEELRARAGRQAGEGLPGFHWRGRDFRRTLRPLS